MPQDDTTPFIFGTISGIFAAVSVNPETVMFKALDDILEAVSDNPWLAILFLIIAAILSIFPLIIWFIRGDIESIMMFIFGFIGGFLIIIITIVGVIIFFAWILIKKFMPDFP